LKPLLRHYKENGIALRERKSGGRRQTARNLSFEDITTVVSFINNFAEQHALVLAGRVPGFKRTDLRLLPSNETKASVWRRYKAVMENMGMASLT